MLTNKLMGGSAGGPANYIEDVFSTYLYTGKGASQTINNGIALADGFSLTPGTALAGGYFGGFISTSGTGVATHALIVAPKATGENSSKQWKTTATSTAGTSSVIDGPTNSANMNNASHPAAQFCEGLTIGGYSDWYMPAKNELEVLYYFLKPTTDANNTSSGSNANAVSPEPISTNYSSGSPAQTSATAFRSGGAEAFAEVYYWSSTEYSAPLAWRQAFSSGLQTYGDKDYSTYVRAVRRVAIADALLDPYRVTGKGGLVWLKSRSAATDHALYDTVRGATFDLVSNSYAAQTTQATGLTAFGSTGFSIGALAKINTNAATYASWTFRKAPKFFDVVTYTGNGTNINTVSHNLGSVPGMMIIKAVGSDPDYGNWVVYHRSITADYYLWLNDSYQAFPNISTFRGTTPTESAFYLGGGQINNSGVTYVAYLFAHDAGGFGASGTDNVISCGSFTTDASGNVGTVTLGWEPQYILVKSATSAQGWFVFDTMRGWTVAGTGNGLLPNTTNADLNYFAGTPYLYPTATGFVGAGHFFGANTTVIYMAIRRGPMRTPTSGTSVFSPIAVTASTPTTRTTGFPIDLQIINNTTRSSWTTSATFDRLRGVSTNTTNSGQVLSTNSTAAEASLAATLGFSNTGYNDANYYSTLPVVSWNFGRAPGFFDVVCYTGNGSSPGQTLNHNLNAVPELIIWKARNNGANNWFVYNATVGTEFYVELNTTTAKLAFSLTGSRTPTSTVFHTCTGGDGSNNGNNITYVAYLFASVSGVSKVGSYTGTGAAQTINCGFTAGARFVLIKRTDSTGDWYTFDTARGMVSGTDPYLLMNSTAAAVNANNVFTSSTGFTIQAAAPAGINASGGTFIYLAVA